MCITLLSFSAEVPECVCLPRQFLSTLYVMHVIKFMRLACFSVCHVENLEKPGLLVGHNKFGIGSMYTDHTER